MFKDILKKLRKSRNLTQQQLASKMNLAKSTISMYENGKREPNFEQLEAFADIFNVDMNTLIGNDIKQNSNEPDEYEVLFKEKLSKLNPQIRKFILAQFEAQLDVALKNQDYITDEFFI